MTLGLVAGMTPEEQADAAQTLVRFQENPDSDIFTFTDSELCAANGPEERFECPAAAGGRVRNSGGDVFEIADFNWTPGRAAGEAPAVEDIFEEAEPDEPSPPVGGAMAVVAPAPIQAQQNKIISATGEHTYGVFATDLAAERNRNTLTHAPSAFTLQQAEYIYQLSEDTKNGKDGSKASSWPDYG